MEHQRIQIDSLQLTSPNGLTHTVQTRHVHDADEIDNDEYGYLDEAEIQGRNRYFMEEKEVICRKCHRAGHIAKDCTTVTCMVCGEDGHMSKDCKLNGKVCHACNMRGHVVNECPLRANGGGNGDGRHQPRPQACDRCSSRTHHTEECATIWRRYVYTGPRPPKYSDVDAWCYNCAAKGHFGDDCSLPRVRGTLAFQGDTAFSSSNCPGKIIHVTSARQPPPAHYDNSRSYQYSSPSGGSSQNREERRREQGYSSRHRSSGSRSSHGPRNPSSASTSSRWSNKDNGTSSSKRPSHRSGQSSGSSQTQHRRF
ncbi:hypothetical protein EV174_003656 [Coemansia sp. RSA 2320]|nr:hypothetical protein EV174_003656 [Coemansia sp. RSA 2320]